MKYNQRNDFAYRLISKYIKHGMSVLDVGCGAGDTSLLIAESVGDIGTVDGVDINSNAIDAALQKLKKLNKNNISFTVADINNNFINKKYDAVFGRRVLMYQSNPLDTIDNLKKYLKPNGIMLFQESDAKGTLLNDINNNNSLKLHNTVQNWIWETVKCEGGNIYIGSELYKLMKSAKMNIIDYYAEAVLQTVETGSDLAWVVNMMQDRMKSFGINPDTDKLEERLSEEMQNANKPFVRDLAFGICAVKN